MYKNEPWTLSKFKKQKKRVAKSNKITTCSKNKVKKCNTRVKKSSYWTFKIFGWEILIEK